MRRLLKSNHVTAISPIVSSSTAGTKETSERRCGVVLAKELALVCAPDGGREKGSAEEVSGTDFFIGEFTGLEMAIKNKEHFPDRPGNYAYFTFDYRE